jgi:nucleoside-diphosphate-sugar epimerase
MQAVPGFKPSLSFEEGIRRMTDWYRQEFA